MTPNQLLARLVRDAGGTLAVARAIGQPTFQGTLWRICSGRVREISPMSARRLADHFGLPLQAMLDADAAEAEWRRRGLGPVPYALPDDAAPRRRVVQLVPRPRTHAAASAQQRGDDPTHGLADAPTATSAAASAAPGGAPAPTPTTAQCGPPSAGRVTGATEAPGTYAVEPDPLATLRPYLRRAPAAVRPALGILLRDWAAAPDDRQLESALRQLLGL